MALDSLLLGGKGSGMTSFFSIEFFVIFLPVCILIYSLVPKKAKKYTLLALSFCFFWFISGKLIVYLLLSILSVHYFGLWIDRIYTQRDEAVKLAEKAERKEIKNRYKKKARYVLLFAVIVHIGILLVLKYTEFFMNNINTVFAKLSVPVEFDIPKYLMPIGISFFSLQAVSYITDVYRGTVKADGNIFRLALFMSFFPQIVEGPICKYSQTAEQLWNVKAIDFDNLSMGLQRFLFGMLKKIVIADRLNPIVSNIFSNYDEYPGGLVAVGAVLYTVQLYMDFSGSMDAVTGVAEIFGVVMPENFSRPFFSKTISEFWKRWHITLGVWFKDYIFYPVSMSKPMKNLTVQARKKLGNHFGPLISGAVALFCVWISNGLWHGARWSYIFFGLYHFALILGGNIIAPAVKKVNTKLKINQDAFVYKLVQILRTTLLVVIGELFFRAEGFRNGAAMFKKMITDFSFSGFNGDMLVNLGVDALDLIIAAVTVGIVFIVSVLNEKGITVRRELKGKNIVLRWTVLIGLILYIVIFGAYGPGYVPVDPMYANF